MILVCLPFPLGPVVRVMMVLVLVVVVMVMVMMMVMAVAMIMLMRAVVCDNHCHEDCQYDCGL